jgi:phospholipid/cholesterol/gamma-HCH transport system substrate-binding protein
MAKRLTSNIKLGLFVLAGLLFLVLLLYMIGKNRNLFGSTYVLKAKFENVQGLVAGNNVRFSGIQAGTVKRVKILSDTVLELTMIIDTKLKPIIRKNAIVSIGTDGLVGNKVVNIVPAKLPAPLAANGDLLATRKSVNTDEMIQTLYNTNNDVAIIAANLKNTVQQINESTGLWDLLNDKSIPADLRISLANIRQATGKAGHMANDLHNIVMNVKNGKGSVGSLLTDTSFSHKLDDAVIKIKNVGEEADSLANELGKVAAEIHDVIAGVHEDINNGKGTVNTLLKDSAMVTKLHASLTNIQKGTEGFNQNMEALKHNFLLRGYFRKQEKQKRKEDAKRITDN